MKMRWTNRTWATLGDSITDANGYQPLVAERLQFAAVVNLGRSGTPMAAGGETDAHATVHMGLGLHPVPDCVTVFAGTNDYRLGKPLGSLHCKDDGTFCGAYMKLIENLLERRPDSRVNLWTPLQRDKDGWDTERRNNTGFRLEDYVEAVKTIGRHYALPVLDLYAESGFTRQTLDFFTTDRLHPNEAGFRRIADMAAAFLARL